MFLVVELVNGVGCVVDFGVEFGFIVVDNEGFIVILSD